jgi:integrase
VQPTPRTLAKAARDRVGGQHRVMALLLGYTGLWWGEVRALRVRHGDPMRCRLSVVENVPDGVAEADAADRKGNRGRVVPAARHPPPPLEGSHA